MVMTHHEIALIELGSFSSGHRLRLEEFAERTKKEAEERRKTRDAEGGRGGGQGHLRLSAHHICLHHSIYIHDS